MARGFVVALLGAESTGKTTLSGQLGAALAGPGRRVEVVAEVLREFCGRHGRTPLEHEQRMIAAEQTRRIEAAAANADLVVADTTALMIAVYSEQVFGDAGLYAEALAAQARCDLTLLTALDLPWVADGLQREGDHVRAPIDALVRELLTTHRIGWSLVSGQGSERVQRAFDAVAPLLRPRAAPGSGLFTRLAERDAAQPAWQWTCEKCDVPDCEHRLRRSAG
jgi:nicotinamide riboside kinase